MARRSLQRWFKKILRIGGPNPELPVNPENPQGTVLTEVNTAEVAMANVTSPESDEPGKIAAPVDALADTSEANPALAPTISETPEPVECNISDFAMKGVTAVGPAEDCSEIAVLPHVEKGVSATLEDSESGTRFAASGGNEPVIYDIQSGAAKITTELESGSVAPETVFDEPDSAPDAHNPELEPIEDPTPAAAIDSGTDISDGIVALAPTQEIEGSGASTDFPISTSAETLATVEDEISRVETPAAPVALTEQQFEGLVIKDLERLESYLEQFGRMLCDCQYWDETWANVIAVWPLVCEKSLAAIDDAHELYVQTKDETIQQLLASRDNSLGILRRMVERSNEATAVGDQCTYEGPVAETLKSAVGQTIPATVDDAEEILSKLQAERWSSLDGIRNRADSGRSSLRSFLERHVIRILEGIESGSKHSANLESSVADSSLPMFQEWKSVYKNLGAGLEPIYTAARISKIESERGQAFDGNIHEAMSAEEDDQLEDDAIKEVMSGGYFLDVGKEGRLVLRCAAVVVVSNKKQELADA
ncbi:MAG TPA: nucleotide exchange factor GrpE [Fimbriimonadaceae bacterium]|jgi:molecular chaperone GrpE (heat shock protein)